MKVITISGFGGPEVFSMHKAKEPRAGFGQIVIDVHASSVNPIDLKIRSGAVPIATPDFPATLHADVAGVVSHVGDGVTHLKEGDEVWGCAGGFKGLPSGALAEFMVTDAKLVSLKPKNLSFSQAAALPLVGLTAWFAMIDRADVSSSDIVLVHAGCGGVGHVGIQLAKHRGATVHTTVSSQVKADIAKGLGADQAIRYPGLSVEDYVTEYNGGRGYDVVFDTIGSTNLDASFEAARFGGKIVNIAARSTHNLAPMHAKALTLHVVFLVGLVANPKNRHIIRPRLEKLRDLVEEGNLKPLLDESRFEFEDVADAHAYLESGKAIGKVVLMR